MCGTSSDTNGPRHIFSPRTFMTGDTWERESAMVLLLHSCSQDDPWTATLTMQPCFCRGTGHCINLETIVEAHRLCLAALLVRRHHPVHDRALPFGRDHLHVDDVPPLAVVQPGFPAAAIFPEPRLGIRLLACPVVLVCPELHIVHVQRVDRVVVINCTASVPSPLPRRSGSIIPTPSSQVR